MLNMDLADVGGQYGTDRRAAHELSPRASNGEAGQERLHLPFQQTVQTNRYYLTWLSIPNTDWQRGFIQLTQNPVQIPAKSTQVPRCTSTTSLEAQRVPILKASSDCSRFHPNRKFPLQTSKHMKVMPALAIWLALPHLLYIFLLIPLSGLLAKSLTITESDLSSKLRKLN